jgi:KaiC/GvpD/RAD55 family RecA-like ATPase
MDVAAIVGRERELERLDAFISGEDPHETLVVVGAPGIGKTTLWDVALARARAAGIRVLSTPEGARRTRACR